ncbi:MAG TPA: competence protein ComK [Virgibacillus sp.]|nr:competence protein ComK [Virgibacillus sp.]HLR67200.1 competence protein ComK [Virgibacillus sp.]
MEKLRQQLKSEKNILNHYIANKNTHLIIPALHMDYESIVLERENVYCVRQNPLNIIKATCEDDWTTYEGRKNIIAKRLNLPHKTPMMLSQEDKIFAYPTLSPKKYNCSWIFLHIVVETGKEGKHGVLLIHDRMKVKLDVSYYILQAQLEKVLILRHAVQGNEKNLYKNMPLDI